MIDIILIGLITSSFIIHILHQRDISKFYKQLMEISIEVDNFLAGRLVMGEVPEKTPGMP